MGVAFRFFAVLTYVCVLGVGCVSAAVTCNPLGGSTIIGAEFVASKCPDQGPSFDFIGNDIECSGGYVRKSSNPIFSNNYYNMTSAAFESLMKQQVSSYGGKLFRNKDGTHFIWTVKYYTGQMDGKNVTSYPSNIANIGVFNRVIVPPPGLPDADGDGFIICYDCNDNNPQINPSAPEVCTDGVDNNCNGLADCMDEACSNEPTCCTDADGDGFAVQGGDCGPVDCDDNDSSVYPGSPEICDGKDNDCDGQVDEDLSTDADSDGHYTPGSCLTPDDDCDDTDPAVPGPEACKDGKDNDCDGNADCVDSECSGDPVCFPRDRCSGSGGSPGANIWE